MQLEVKITDVAYGLWLKEKLKLWNNRGGEFGMLVTVSGRAWMEY